MQVWYIQLCLVGEIVIILNGGCVYHINGTVVVRLSVHVHFNLGLSPRDS